MRVKNKKIQNYYLKEIVENDWFVRTLDRNISTLYYNRLLFSQVIAILFCTETNQIIVRYSVLNDNKQLFATKYMAYIPSEEELQKEKEQQKRNIFTTKK
ncbi:MAG: hypothetical protein LBV69_02620 [Bacteroidales bacterium]|jgi:predicted nuclease of restriction endonuclease-like (RecB) superfamily|nr:hypothetical protein [Bacteroidales bacterium]